MSTTEDEAKTEAQLRLADLPKPVPFEVYRHYKGGMYSVVSVSLMEDTLVPLVTYRSNRKRTRWTRTLANFTEEVEVNGRRVPRFEKHPD